MFVQTNNCLVTDWRKLRLFWLSMHCRLRKDPRHFCVVRLFYCHFEHHNNSTRTYMSNASQNETFIANCVTIVFAWQSNLSSLEEVVVAISADILLLYVTTIYHEGHDCAGAHHGVFTNVAQEYEEFFCKHSNKRKNLELVSSFSFRQCRWRRFALFLEDLTDDRHHENSKAAPLLRLRRRQPGVPVPSQLLRLLICFLLVFPAPTMLEDDAAVVVDRILQLLDVAGDGLYYHQHQMVIAFLDQKRHIVGEMNLYSTWTWWKEDG